MVEVAYNVTEIPYGASSSDGETLWFQFKVQGGGDETTTLIFSKEKFQELLVFLHQLGQKTAALRQQLAGAGRPMPMPLTEIVKTEAIDLFDPAMRGFRAHIRNSSTIDFCMAPMAAAQLANQLRGKQDSKPRGRS